MNIRKHAIRTAAAWAAFFAFLLLARPGKLPVLLLIVPFILLFVALISLWSLVVPAVRRLIGQRGYAGSPRLRLTVCASAVLLLVLQSLGQLTIRDVGTILAIVIIGYLYVGHSRSEQQDR